MSETFKHLAWSQERAYRPSSGDVLQQLIDGAGIDFSQGDFDGPATPTPERHERASQEWLERVVKAMDL